MNTTIKSSALVAAIVLVMPYLAYADPQTEPNEKYAYKRLQIQLSSLTCYNNFTTGYLNDVVSVINNSTITSAISGIDLPNLQSGFANLKADASVNNTDQFKTDAKTYRNDTKTANLDARAAIRTVGDKTISTTLKSDMKSLQAEYRHCLLGNRLAHVTLKERMFDHSLLRAENMTKRLGLHGMNTTSLQNTMHLAGDQIQTFESKILNGSQDIKQLRNASKSFCLYNGCKGPNNFHFGAKMVIDANQARLNLLATKNSTESYQTLVSQAQTDLNNAQAALNLTGSDKYQGTQSSDIWNDIKNATSIIRQLEHMTGHKH